MIKELKAKRWQNQSSILPISKKNSLKIRKEAFYLYVKKIPGCWEL